MAEPREYNVIVVGAGFAGMYMLHRYGRALSRALLHYGDRLSFDAEHPRNRWRRRLRRAGLPYGAMGV